MWLELKAEGRTVDEKAGEVAGARSSLSGLSLR